ncbi:MAG: Panacea domain-containing protein [Nitrospirota bacterium]
MLYYGMKLERERLKGLISAVLSQAGQVPKMKLAKLILLAEIEYYKKAGKSITGLYFLRLTYGPVIAFFDEALNEGIDILWTKETSDVHESGRQGKQYSYRCINKDTVPPVSTPHAELWSEVQETITSVVYKYGGMTGMELSNISHKLPAWRYSEPNEPIYVSELAIDTEEKYFAMLDIVEEMEEMEDDSLEEKLFRTLQNT